MPHAPTPCIERDCWNHATHKGRCDTHQKPAWFGSNRKHRLPSDWRTRRLIVLKRDKGICYMCGESGADTVDHLIPGDDHSLENLKAIHDRIPPHCHRQKTAEETARIRRGNQIKRRR